MIVLFIPNQKDGRDNPHQWRQKPNKRQKILLVEHLPSLDHDGEANQAGGGVSDSKVVKIISSNYSRNNIYVYYFKELLPRVITRRKTMYTDVAVYCPAQPPEAAVLKLNMAVSLLC